MLERQKSYNFGGIKFCSPLIFEFFENVLSFGFIIKKLLMQKVIEIEILKKAIVLWKKILQIELGEGERERESLANHLQNMELCVVVEKNLSFQLTDDGHKCFPS